MYKKVIVDGYILGVGLSDHGNIDKTEYDRLTALFDAMPTAPEGYEAKLNATTLDWELVEIPPEPEPEPTAEEALDFLLGGDT